MKKRILCYGDSNTWGYIPGSGARYDDDIRWTGVLQALLGDGYTVLEDGINGRTTVYEQDWAKGRNGLKGLPYSLQAQMPLDLVILMLGTNDLSMMSMNFVELGIREITRNFLKADSIIPTAAGIWRGEPRVLLIAPPPYGEKYDAMYGAAMAGKYADSLQFPEVCSRVAELLGCAYLDGGLYAEISPVDQTHFTAEGHRRFGQAVAAKVKELFGAEAD